MIVLFMILEQFHVYELYVTFCTLIFFSSENTLITVIQVVRYRKIKFE